MRFTTYLTAGALAALTQAQTFTECNPMEKDCPNDPAMAENFETDFKQGAAGVKGWKQTAGSLTYNSEGTEFTVSKQGDAPTIQSEGYLHFGYVEVKCKAAPGQGIVSSIVVQSENLDETDWEFIGGVNDKVQMNYFGKGNTTTYDRMIENPVADAQGQMHTYALEWTKDALTWIIDGQEVRTLNYADANGGKNFPQTPSTVRIGIWAGGDPNNEQGVIEWAGGETDYTKAPFTMTVESVKVINYSPGKEYEWTDRSGSWESIKVIEPGNKEGAAQNSAVLEPTATADAGGLQSGINVPIGTGYSGQPVGTGYPGSPAQPGESAPCSTDEVPLPATTPIPYPTGNSTSPQEPCDCEEGIATVTVTGQQPPAETPPPEVPASSVVPPAGGPATSGLIIETSPAPSIPIPSAPSGVIPPVGGNATVSGSPPPEFTGAASSNKAGALLGVAAGAILLAF